MSSLPVFARLLIVPSLCLVMASCETTKSGADDDSIVSNYSSDGRYNPYPDSSSGTRGSAYTPPVYETPPTPSSEPDYAFDAPTPPSSSVSSTPKKSTATSTASAKPKSSTPTKKASSLGGSYTVVKGDTLYGIARKRGTTVAKLKAANGLSSDLIRIGQKLKVQ